MKSYNTTTIGKSLLLLLLALSVQGCLGIGNNNNSSSNGPVGNTITTNSSGNKVSVAQNLFKGKIYFTIDHNLWVTDGSSASRELIHGGNVYDPAVSPDGKWIAFIARFKDFTNLAAIPAGGGPVHILLSGDGHFYNDTGIIKNTYHWFAQPAWSLDGTHLLFLSDLQKDFVWYTLGGVFKNSPFLDLQVFSIPFNNPSAQPQVIAYASYGDGGDRDPSYRPAHPTQTPEIVYTHYAYDQTGTQQVIQVFLADATAIANHPYTYSPVSDSGVPLTPGSVQNIEPAFSPDGNAIVYVRRDTSNQMSLYIMPVPEGVTADPNSPTAEQKALQPYNKSSHILSGQYVSQPVWSPDGKQIVYISYNNSEFDLWLANISYNAKTGAYSLQGNPIQLTSGGIDGDSRPFWTP
jgi:Tol biopolymer transport system component